MGKGAEACNGFLESKKPEGKWLIELLRELVLNLCRPGCRGSGFLSFVFNFLLLSPILDELTGGWW